VPHDTHDWDLTHAGPIVGDSGLIAAGKDGIVRMLDRRDGRIIWSTPVSRQLNTSAPITTQGVYVCPGVYGGILWNAPFFDPLTGLVFVNAVDYCGTYTRASSLRFHPPESYMGGEFRPDVKSRSGVMTALDATTGTIKWTQRTPRGLVAGIAVSDGVAYTGDLDGHLLGFEATSGKPVVRDSIGVSVGGGVVAFSVNGTRYLVISAGRPSAQLITNDVSAARVIVRRR
jgi:alcohol dehydrogenase (cytochrome c)